MKRYSGESLARERLESPQGLQSGRAVSIRRCPGTCAGGTGSSLDNRILIRAG